MSILTTTDSIVCEHTYSNTHGDEHNTKTNRNNNNDIIVEILSLGLKGGFSKRIFIYWFNNNFVNLMKYGQCLHFLLVKLCELEELFTLIDNNFWCSNFKGFAQYQNINFAFDWFCDSHEFEKCVQKYGNVLNWQQTCSNSLECVISPSYLPLFPRITYVTPNSFTAKRNIHILRQEKPKSIDSVLRTTID